MPLATLADLKADLGISDTGQDAVLTGILAQASDAAERWCQRRFAVAGYSRRILHRRLGAEPAPLPLGVYPVVAVTALTYDGDPVDPAGYEVEADFGFLWRLDSRDTRCRWYAGEYRAEFTAGYVLPGDAPVTGAEPLPDGLQRGVLELAKTLWYGRSRDPSIRIEEVPDVATVTYGTVAAIGGAGVDALPGHVTAWLAPHQAYLT